MAAGKTTFGELIAEFQRVITRNAPLLLLVGIALAVANTLLSYLLPDRGDRAISGIAGLVVGYFLLRELLSREGLVQSAGGFWGYFAAGFLTGLGIILGLICLIVPGIYLAARWCLAAPIVLAQGERVTNSMRESWAVTEGNVWSLVLFGLVVLGVYLLAGALIGALLGFGGLAGSFVQTALTELISAIGSILGTAAITGIYRQLVGGTQEFEDTFA